MPSGLPQTIDPISSVTSGPSAVAETLTRFVHWLDAYGETSLDHQSFFAGPIGGSAKALYYRNTALGTAVVAPMIFFEAFLPSARRLFHERTRFPIADAHYAMGFAYLYQATGDRGHLDRAVRFLRTLQQTRSPGYKEYCWGYPFDWVTSGGTYRRNTPFITSTPYAYEAFLQVYRIDGRTEWREVLESIVRHVCADIKDVAFSETASSCGYSPDDIRGGVVNAAAYRAFTLTSASRLFERDEYWRIAERNLAFVLESQNADGSWPYRVDGTRPFVDHFHTCFVMKALAKIHSITGSPACLDALTRGVRFYLEHLFAADGLPRPFARAPRPTVYKRELYDCAEAINLCLLLRDRFPECGTTLEAVVSGILRDWVKPDGSFRSRQLIFGWDNVPMHRWAQSQMFRNLSSYHYEMHAEAASGRAGHSRADLPRDCRLCVE
jgi:Prenyltransferase and squalene oxidase repeat